MKSLLVTAVLLLQTQAFADPALLCTAKLDPKSSPGEITSIRLEAQGALKVKGRTTLEDVTALVQYKDYETQGQQVKTAEGAGKVLAADLSYKPTKYKNYSRLNLNELQNQSRYPNELFPYLEFQPSDECLIEVLIPNSWMDGEGFYAPVQIHCNQSGGFALMECQNL